MSALGTMNLALFAGLTLARARELREELHLELRRQLPECASLLGDMADNNKRAEPGFARVIHLLRGNAWQFQAATRRVFVFRTLCLLCAELESRELAQRAQRAPDKNTTYASHRSNHNQPGEKNHE